jgi:hypothetical protein
MGYGAFEVVPSIGVLPNGTQKTSKTSAVVPLHMPELILVFMDDAGIIWRKYDGGNKGQLTRVKRG